MAKITENYLKTIIKEEILKEYYRDKARDDFKEKYERMFKQYLINWSRIPAISSSRDFLLPSPFEISGLFCNFAT